MVQSLGFTLNSLKCHDWRLAKSEHQLGRHGRVQRDSGDMDWHGDGRRKEMDGLKTYLKNELELLMHWR